MSVRRVQTWQSVEGAARILTFGSVCSLFDPAGGVREPARRGGLDVPRPDALRNPVARSGSHPKGRNVVEDGDAVDRASTAAKSDQG